MRRLAGLVFALACSWDVAKAVDPGRTMTQYVREHWGSEQGLPRGPIYAITQTPDGYLWIGTESGLLRFDGFQFTRMDSDFMKPSPISHVLGLVVDREGSLWARLRRPTLLRYRDGGFADLMEQFGHPRASVVASTRAYDGNALLWVLEREGSAVKLEGKAARTIATPAAFTRSPVLAIAQTADQSVWVGTRDAGLFRLNGSHTEAITQGLPDLKVNALVATENELWVATDGGIVRWDGKQLTKAGVPSSLEGVQALAMALDRDANLWVGTNSRGVLRVNSGGVASFGAPESEEAVTAIFEDREGNLWIGSGNGLDRLRDSTFVSYSVAEGANSDGSNPIAVDTKGRLWFGPEKGGLEWIGEGRKGNVGVDGLDRDVVYSIANGKDGLWLGRQRGGLTRLQAQNGTMAVKTYTRADGLAQDSVYSVYETPQGEVWAGTLSGGVSRLRSGRFTTYSVANGLSSNTVNSILQTADGALWVGTAKGLNVMVEDKWRSYGLGDGLPGGEINCLTEDSSGGLWIGTNAGLAWRAGGKIQNVAAAHSFLREQILGMAEDETGWLWISSANHVFRVNREKLQRGEIGEGDWREYGRADGLRGVEGVKRSRSLIRGQDGRIWISLNRGISVVDPKRVRKNGVPALPHLESIVVDGRPVRLSRRALIPGGGQRVTLTYSGLSLGAPEAVQFRFRLQPFDPGWSKAVASREAVYTNLSPGEYQFSLMASNPDGVWSDVESVSLVVEPLYWQTWWFRVSLVVVCAVMIIALYRFRLHQMHRQMTIRFEERLAERTRIAQELHDTLLQGFLSASMQVHMATDRLPVDSQVKPALSHSLMRMRQVIEEARSAVRGLRSTKSGSLDLEDAFARIQEELGLGGEGIEAVDFRVVSDGKVRPLHPLLRDELYRIGREALLNSFRHARASRIELQMRYSSHALTLSVRDDGCGIDMEILNSGRDGHWGLAGMRERAEGIGATIRIWSRGSEGTEVELVVPGDRAYEDHREGIGSWLRRYFARAKGIGSPSPKEGDFEDRN